MSVISSHVIPIMFSLFLMSSAATLCNLFFLFARTADLAVRLEVAGRLWLICSVYAGDKTWLKHQAKCVHTPLSATLSSQLVSSTFPSSYEFNLQESFFFLLSQCRQLLIFFLRLGMPEVKSAVSSDYMEVNICLYWWRDRALTTIWSKQWPV